MPLFKCSKCGCIDNTACGGSYWGNSETPECSECFTGKWSAPFPKQTPEQMGLIPDPHHPPFYSSLANIEMVRKERAKS